MRRCVITLIPGAPDVLSRKNLVHSIECQACVRARQGGSLDQSGPPGWVSRKLHGGSVSGFFGGFGSMEILCMGRPRHREWQCGMTVGHNTTCLEWFLGRYKSERP